jgi:MFS family permease
LIEPKASSKGRSDKLPSLDAIRRSQPPVNAVARHATYAMFLADSLGFGIWQVNIPVFKQRFELSNSALSIILLAVAAGSIVSMPIAGQAVRHFGNRLRRRKPWLLCLVPRLSCPSTQFVFICRDGAAFWRAKASVEVGINAQAVVVEADYDRPIMTSFQALWSVGGLAGGFLTGVTLSLGSTPGKS